LGQSLGQVELLLYQAKLVIKVEFTRAKPGKTSPLTWICLTTNLFWT